MVLHRPVNRKNQKVLSKKEWDTFINAINSMHGTRAKSPAYREFVDIHVQAMSHMGMSWRVHSMRQMGMIGVNFLAWHRHYLMAFEDRLGQPIPYWDWINDPQVPARLAVPRLLKAWSVTRVWTPELMPTKIELDSATDDKSFNRFQIDLEAVHGGVHNALGLDNRMNPVGTMATATSPADPIFWLHHSNIDRIWAEWQIQHPDAKPRNLSEILQTTPNIWDKSRKSFRCPLKIFIYLVSNIATQDQSPVPMNGSNN